MHPEDAESLALVKLGSGANLLGFYMYHGGENPDGKLTNLNETQATNYWNDLPVKNYDFQAPIGEYGQEREHYHFLRLLGLFLKDFGPGLAGMSSRMPNGRGSLNWVARSDGDSGYIFVSNYQRLSPQPDRENVQFRIKFADGDVNVPSEPVTIPYNCRFFWPLNLDLGGVKLICASAQPICQVNDGNDALHRIQTDGRDTRGIRLRWGHRHGGFFDRENHERKLADSCAQRPARFGRGDPAARERTEKTTSSFCSTRRRRGISGKANGRARNVFS